MQVAIRRATAGDFPLAIQLLRVAGLPTDDVTPNVLALVAECEAAIVGVIGLELYGDVALLRSLVVVRRARSSGVGRSLVRALESLAGERRVRELWLLTIDAERFFSGLGFSVRGRDAAPEAIRESAEFSSLCPDDAVLMSKAL